MSYDDRLKVNALSRFEPNYKALLSKKSGIDSFLG